MKNKEKRIGFHSIESIIKNNPHKIKKLFLPHSRDDKRINNLIALSKRNGIKYLSVEDLLTSNVLPVIITQIIS